MARLSKEEGRKLIQSLCERRSSEQDYNYEVYKEELHIVSFQKYNYLSLIIYKGTSTTPIFNSSFFKSENREKYIEQIKERFDLINESKLKRREEKKLFTPTVKIGDIFVDSWGYEQTNVNYYQVIELVGEKSVKVQEISKKTVEGSEGNMSCNILPVKDSFLSDSEPFTSRVQQGNRIKVRSYSSASLWTGGSNYCSWYA